jgi:V8-like Glu-specific endopeptidase
MYTQWKKFTGVLVSILLTVVVVPVGSASAIAGGTKVPPGKYPWLVKVGNQTEGYCSASLISAEHILTAAHCVGKTPGKPSRMYAHFLGVDRPHTGFTVRVIWTQRHPRAKHDARQADVALLTLERPVRVRPIRVVTCDSNCPIEPGRKLTVAGYGKTGEQQGKAADRPRELVFTATDNCDRSGKQWFCANAPSPDTGVRGGDSGGPAFIKVTAHGNVRYVLVGTVSNHQGANTWFANLSMPEINHWIRDVISSDLAAGRSRASVLDAG